MRRMFSEKQIGEVAVEQLVDKDLKVKSIEQSEANAEFTITLPEITGLSFDSNAFIKVKRINGILMIIIASRVTTDGDYVSQSNIPLTFELPDNISKNIFRLDGTSCDKEPDGNSNICGDPYLMSGSIKYAALVSYHKNEYTLNLYNPGFAANNSYSLDLRLILAIV